MSSDECLKIPNGADYQEICERNSKKKFDEDCKYYVKEIVKEMDYSTYPVKVHFYEMIDKKVVEFIINHFNNYNWDVDFKIENSPRGEVILSFTFTSFTVVCAKR